jgi:protein tyrosine phosphatase (PTP) superfamily phosphohydrolase (DUF442 family)
LTRLAARSIGAIGAWLAAALAAPPVFGAVLPPNLVEITPRLVTAGQPSRAALEGLKSEGFGAVLNLAPATAPDAVMDEPVILNRLGIAYVNIPVNFEHPGEADYETFAYYLKAQAGRKVLVHCQINLRASAMVFLYRAIALKEDPAKAYEAVTRVWAPDETWKRFMTDLLLRHGIRFEPY